MILKRWALYIFGILSGIVGGLFLVERVPDIGALPSYQQFLIIITFSVIGWSLAYYAAPTLFPLDTKIHIGSRSKKNWAWLRPESITQKSGFPINKERQNIGRDVKNAIMIDDKSISREHAQILRIPQGYSLRDLGSSNGTFVNGQRISECKLKDGDLLSFGNIEYRFELPKKATERKPLELLKSDQIDSQIKVQLQPSTGSSPLADPDEEEEGTSEWNPTLDSDQLP